MSDAWANSADTTPANPEPSGDEEWGSIANSRVDRDSYQDDSTIPPDRDVRRSRSRSPTREGGRGDSNPGTNLHVSGLHRRVTDQLLEDTFSKYGKVGKAQVVYDPHTRDSRGFAFVMMSTLEEAEAAITGLNGYVLEGMALRVDKARRGRARTPTPGRYSGAPKRDYYERRYEPHAYDDRYRSSRYSDDGRGSYSRGYDRDYEDRRRYDDRRYNDSRSRYNRDYDRYDDRRYERYRYSRNEDYRGSQYDERGGRYSDGRR